MARAQKLKVFRTPIGFHDAYVAAPSRKAALAAWGSDADLFARGVAEQVEDEALMREPLASPGKVIRRSRGTTAEQLAALPPDPPKRSAPAALAEDSAETPEETGAKPRPRDRRPGADYKPRPFARPAKPPPKPKQRPSRKPLDDAERELEELAERQMREAAALREEEQALARRRRETERRHERGRAAAEAAVERERGAYADALARS